MKLFTKQIGRYPLGIWVAIVAIIFTFFAWMIQFYSLVDWEGAINLGFQNESFSGDDAEQVLANVERGIAYADMFWPLPLTIIGLIGVLRKKFIALIAAMMDFAICIYFPLFFAFQRWHTHPDVVLSAIFLFAIPSLAGIIGLWMNRKSLIN